MRFLIILGTVVCAAQAEQSVCEVGISSGKCASTQPNCQLDYECVDGNCCQAKERLCPHNQRSHGLCDRSNRCPDPGHECVTTDDGKNVCCNKNQPKPKQRDCLSKKPCESSKDCQKSYECVEGNCCKNSDSGDSDWCPEPYSHNLLLGCFLIVNQSIPVVYLEAKQRCALDGGQFLLVNSKEEADELKRIFYAVDALSAYIQGYKSTDSDWEDDDGNALQYLPTLTPIFGQFIPDNAALVFAVNENGDEFYFTGSDPNEPYIRDFICEIEN